jgi:hypothetical protein
MNVVSHVLFPVAFAQAADGYREHNRETKSFDWKQLLLIGFSGGLPDLVSPHVTFEGRYGSLLHSIWFVLAVSIMSVALMSKFKRARPLICFCCFAMLFHLFCDMISGGINLLAPGGMMMAGGNYIRTRYWVALDVTAILLFFYSFLYGRYRNRARPLVLVLGLIVCAGGAILALSRLDTESIFVKRVPLGEINSTQLERVRQTVQTLFRKWQAGIYEPMPGEFTEQQRTAMTPQWQESFHKQIRVAFGEYQGVLFTEMATSRFYYPRGCVYWFKGSFSRMPQQPEIRITLDSNDKIFLNWSDSYRDRLMGY